MKLLSFGVLLASISTANAVDIIQPVTYNVNHTPADGYVGGIINAALLTVKSAVNLVDSAVPIVIDPPTTQVIVQPVVPVYIQPSAPVYVPKPVNYVPGQYTEACRYYGQMAAIFNDHGNVIGWRFCD